MSKKTCMPTDETHENYTLSPVKRYRYIAVVVGLGTGEVEIIINTYHAYTGNKTHHVVQNYSNCPRSASLCIHPIIDVFV